MNAVCTACARNVRAVVDDKSRLAPACEAGCARRQLEEDAGGEILFAELDERDARGDGRRAEPEQSLKLRALLSGRGSGLAARYQVEDRRS